MEQIKRLTDAELRELLNECDELDKSLGPALESTSDKLKELFNEFDYTKFWSTKFSNIKMFLTYEAKNRFLNNG